MIYEIRTYTLRPGSVPEYLTRFAESYPIRAKYSPMYGMWSTEIGPLNQIVHIWAYENLQQRADTRAAATKDPSGKWPPGTRDLTVTQENDILVPIDGWTHQEGPQELGGLYELRMYTYAPGNVQSVAKTFSEKIGGRVALYPVGGI